MEGKAELKKKVNIRCKIFRLPETQLKMNVNVALYVFQNILHVLADWDLANFSHTHCDVSKTARPRKLLTGLTGREATIVKWILITSNYTYVCIVRWLNMIVHLQDSSDVLLKSLFYTFKFKLFFFSEQLENYVRLELQGMLGNYISVRSLGFRVGQPLALADKSTSRQRAVESGHLDSGIITSIHLTSFSHLEFFFSPIILFGSWLALFKGRDFVTGEKPQVQLMMAEFHWAASGSVIVHAGSFSHPNKMEVPLMLFAASVLRTRVKMPLIKKRSIVDVQMSIPNCIIMEIFGNVPCLQLL